VPFQGEDCASNTANDPKTWPTSKRHVPPGREEKSYVRGRGPLPHLGKVAAHVSESKRIIVGFRRNSMETAKSEGPHEGGC